MERARSSSVETSTMRDIPGGGATLLVRSYSAGSSSGVNNWQEQEQNQERRRRERPWARVARLKRKAEEQRTRLYIVRRCLHMLLCWRDDTER
ncbi:unnamed protein product [Alopecurus aequalis]